MKDKLSVGMFIRTPLGIDKIIYLRIQDEYGCNFDTQLKHNLFLNNERDNISIDGECFEKEEIKANYNITDLISRFDLVNGHLVICKMYEDEKDIPTIIKCVGDYYFKEEDIKSVITHEQMEQIEYKVEE